MFRHTSIVLLISNLTICMSALAVEPDPLLIGDVAIIPSISLDISNNDNIFKTDLNKVDSLVSVVTPSLMAVLQKDNSQWTIQADVVDITYYDSPADDFTDIQISGLAEFQINSRNFLDFSASQLMTHEDRGTNFSQGGNIPAAPAEYDLLNYGLGYQFGAPGSRGHLDFNYSYAETEYTTNRAVTLTRDQEQNNFDITFTVDLLSRTDFLLRLQYSDINYINDFPVLDPLVDFGSLDSEETFGMFGVEWEATAKTSGRVLLGYGEKTFKSPLRDNQDNLSWEVELRWEPLTYSALIFSSNSSFEEATITGSNIEVKAYALAWEHSWSERLSSNISFNNRDESFGNDTREDTTDTVSSSLLYSYARWLDISLSFNWEKRESNINIFNYSQNLITLGFEASI